MTEINRKTDDEILAECRFLSDRYEGTNIRDILKILAYLAGNSIFLGGTPFMEPLHRYFLGLVSAAIEGRILEEKAKHAGIVYSVVADE